MRKILYRESRSDDFTKEAYFHQWDPSDSACVAIIELPDGTIDLIGYYNIMFVDKTYKLQ